MRGKPGGNRHHGEPPKTCRGIAPNGEIFMTVDMELRHHMGANAAAPSIDFCRLADQKLKLISFSGGFRILWMNSTPLMTDRYTAHLLMWLAITG